MRRTRRSFDTEKKRMKYNFDECVDRKNTASLKWDIAEGELPMWVADMDFKTAPQVTEAILKRAKHGVFGYNIIPDRWYSAYISRWKEAHGFELQRDWLIFCTGVVPAISSIVKRLTSHGDNVAVQTPVYDIFFHSIENAGRHAIEAPLKYEEGGYEIDFSSLEEKLSHPLTTMLILCNPHNPVGRVWTKDELIKIGELCDQYGVTVLSDEIHCDIVRSGVSYTPFASASEICRKLSVTCISASKAFNLAGLQSSAVVVPDENLRHKVIRCLNSDELAEPNSFAVESTIAALTEGGEWLKELNGYLFENRKICEDFIRDRLPELHLVKGEATYLLWIDCSKITSDSEELRDFIRGETGLWLSAGAEYRGNGRYFLRMNIACPKSRLLDGLERLYHGIKAYRSAEAGEKRRPPK